MQLSLLSVWHSAGAVGTRDTLWLRALLAFTNLPGSLRPVMCHGTYQGLKSHATGVFTATTTAAGLHYTYPRDRQAALADLLKEPHTPTTPPPETCALGKGLSEEEQLLGSRGGQYSVEGIHAVEYETDQQELQRLFPDDQQSLHRRSLTEGR